MEILKDLKHTHLMSAAPDLYAALKRYVEHFGDPLKCARAAIAKAEGSSEDHGEYVSL